MHLFRSTVNKAHYIKIHENNAPFHFSWSYVWAAVTSVWGFIVWHLKFKLSLFYYYDLFRMIYLLGLTVLYISEKLQNKKDQ